MKTLEKIIFCNNPMCSWTNLCLRFKEDSENRFIFNGNCANYISKKNT